MSKLLWFVIIFGTVVLGLACLGIWVEKSNQRRAFDLEYDIKITRQMERIDPYYKFFYNLFGWILALLVFYYIYLG